MIEYHKDLSLFFYEMVHEAMQLRKLEAPIETEHYLVTMLVSLSYESVNSSLVELTTQAQQQPNADKYKNVGDLALALLGFFEEHLARKNITTSYVENLGSRAYRIASSIASTKDKRAAVFYDLSANFPKYAQVLDDIRENTTLGTPPTVLGLYERYTKTESPVLLSKLLNQGLIATTVKIEA